MKIKTPRKEGKTKHLFGVYGIEMVEMDKMFNWICDVYTKYHDDSEIIDLEKVFIGLVDELFVDSSKIERCKMAFLMLAQFQVLSEQINKAQKSGRKKKPLVNATDVVEALVIELQKRA